MSLRASAARDRCLELERVIADRARSGSLGLDDARKLFEELLLLARPASVVAFNHLLSVFARARCSSASELAISRFNRMARACSNKAMVFLLLDLIEAIGVTFKPFLAVFQQYKQ